MKMVLFVSELVFDLVIFWWVKLRLKGDIQYSPEEKLLRAIFGEKSVKFEILHCVYHLELKVLLLMLKFSHVVVCVKINDIKIMVAAETARLRK